MTLEAALVMLGAGFLAGALNAAAGGGSFVSIPAMVFVGLPSVAANASSTVALLPGTLTSAWAWRGAFRSLQGFRLPVLVLISLVGGLAGAVLLLSTSQRAFDDVLPWLLLVGTLAFTFGRPLGAALRQRVRIGRGPVLASQVLLSVYAGYFGGGVGIMMMAVWGMLGDLDIKAMSALRTLLVSIANLVAVLIFVVAGPVHWPETLAMLVSAIIGGYAGARLASRVPDRVLRGFVILFSTLMTVVFFWRAWR
ncbi:sulfite exporter TauE/SafE family protein [Roseomonas sp. KE2513]|uniref:sulfite exporter TauE/SafE family protein n=1 Tax=Roseomonas sp. KE2513 TaxID=2479202 RepID=UPI0018DFE0F5|nr:sulfite exporter TauE/SafE family protein [Roseomonas sp. KE2513]MBI0535460.1 sulfite exporter TauE/SafE family protein [Roseomonas sp. KE2513]